MGVLDLEDALRRLEHDREALQILFKLFLSEHKDDLWDIRTALRRQQPEVACRLLHTLKGVSANISASRLQLLAGELEWRLRLQEELSEGELNQLQQVFTQTREEVSHFLLGRLPVFAPRQAALREGKIAIVLKSPASGYDDPLVRPRQGAIVLSFSSRSRGSAPRPRTSL